MKLKTIAFAAAAFMAIGGAHAATQTLTVGGSLTGTDANNIPWKLDGLSGSGTLSFSSLLVTALNTAQVKLAQVDPAILTTPTSTTSSGVVKYTAASAAAPVTSLSGDFDGTTLAVSGVATAGGASLVTVKNGATNGAGSLSITNITVDLTTSTVFADIVGGNGVGAKNHFALWTYKTLGGDTSFTVPNPAVQKTFTVQNSLTGLFASADSIAMFTQALNLNSIGAGALASVNDPAKGGGAGFGSILSTISVTATPQVPEPSTYALMGLGLVGMSLVVRRRAR